MLPRCVAVLVALAVLGLAGPAAGGVGAGEAGAGRAGAGEVGGGGAGGGEIGGGEIGGGEIGATGPPAVEPTADPAPATQLRVDREPLGAARRAGAGVIGAHPVAPFEVFGVTAEAFAGGHPELEVRFHDADGWGGWIDLHHSPDHAPDRGTAEAAAGRSASEPIWVGEADGYQLRVPGSTGTAPRSAFAPGGDALLVRDTGRPAPDGPEAGFRADDPAVAGRAALATQPAIRSRSTWGARPPATFPLRADDLELAVVHHAVTANVYSRAQVPGIIRGIQAFHMDGQGWNDIAYNFVVDRFGTIWEGRAGGIANTVIGGHAQGFNTGSTGIVALGELGSAGVTSAMRNAYRTLIGWKLFIHGVDPAGSTVYESRGNDVHPAGKRLRLPRVIGHRDTWSTACPGANLYALLPTIRAGAAVDYRSRRGPGSFTSVPLTLGPGQESLVGDFDGDGYDDVVLYGPGAESDGLAWGRADGQTPVQDLVIRGEYLPIVGDFDGDYRDDILWYGPGAAYDTMWLGQEHRAFVSRPVVITGDYQPIVGDFDDDDADDILWYGPGSAPDSLWFGNWGGTFTGRGTNVAGVYEPFVGDFDGDGSDDIFWYGPGPDRDSLWAGHGSRGFEIRPVRVIGRYQPLVGDFDGDQRDDVFWYGAGTAKDALWTGRIDGTFGSPGPVDIKGSYVPLVGDFDGGGHDDLLLYGPGTLPDRLLLGHGNGAFRTIVIDVRGHYQAHVVDLGHDGLSDVLWHGVGARIDRIWRARS